MTTAREMPDMAEPTKSERIRKLAEEILRSNPTGLNYTPLCKEIQSRDEKLNWNTICAQTWKFLEERDDIEKPSRGKYLIVDSGTQSELRIPSASMQPERKHDRNEEKFYEPFAKWLTRDMEDATKAVPLGGNRFGDKWGTPDVIGKRVSKQSDMIEQPIEIVSAEIKTETSQLITAFGQAVAYCLFSHRSYLVIPEQASGDIPRLDSLCQAFGLGLVLFDATNPQNPNFKIRTRPRRQEPDYFYINKNMKKIERELFA